jgi:hypothetical protein
LWVLLSILVLAAVLRLIHLTYESAWLDEIYSMRFVSTRGLLQVVRDSFRMDYHPFAYYALLDVWVKVLGLSDFTSRLLSAVLGVGAVSSAYYLTKTAFRDCRAAHLCALMAAISPTHLYYSQEARMYILMILVWPVFLGSLYQCWRTSYSIRSSSVLMLTFAIFAYSQGTSGLFALPVLLCSATVFAAYASVKRHRPGALRAIAIGAAGVAVYTPWLVRLLQLRSSTGARGAFGIAESLQLLQRLVLYDHPLSTERIALLILATVGLILILFRWRQLQQWCVGPSVPLLISIAAVLVLQWLICLMKPVYLARSLVFLVSPLLALMSFSVVRLAELSRDRAAVRWRRLPATACVITLVIAWGVAMARSAGAAVKHGYGKEPWREAVRAIEPTLGPHDVVVFHADFMQICWDHYAVLGERSTTNSQGTLARYVKLGLPRPDNWGKADPRKVQNVVSSLRQTRDRQSYLWMLYSHVRDQTYVDSLLLAAGLTGDIEWKGHDILARRFVRRPGTSIAPAGEATSGDTPADDQ